MIQFDPITKGLFVGSCPVNATDVDRLGRALRISAVFNLQTDEDFKGLGIDWPSLEENYSKLDISVVRHPIRDFDRDDLKKHISSAANELGRLIDVGHTVYVHCTAGRERSPATVIAFLVECRQYTLTDAIEFVTDRRQCNPFIDVLEQVYQR